MKELLLMKVLFKKKLLLYLRYFCFKCAKFSRVKLKVVSKLLRESPSETNFLSESLQKVYYQNYYNSDKIIFAFTFGKGK